MATAEVNLLLRLLDEGYDRKSWHGPNLCGSVRGVGLDEVCWRPGSERRNIWEIVVHTAYWKYIVRRRLLGEKRGSFPLKGSNWFARPAVRTAKAWRADLGLLEAMQATLRAAVAAFDPARLAVTPAGSTVSNLAMVSGVAAHDVYHAGQIQLLKRLARDAAAKQR
jgi:hypothetical protein